MHIVMIPYHSYPCRLEEFTINDEPAEVEDFGKMVNTRVDSCPDVELKLWGCTDMNFVPNTDDVRRAAAMDKYGLNKWELEIVENQLMETLKIGPCYWCT